MANKLDRFQHREKDVNGRFRKSPLCDGCNKPVGTNYFTDDEVCAGSDGPGFYLCERKRCFPGSEKLTPAEREAIYVANRNARGEG